MILYICFPLNSTVWLFPPRDFVIQPELLKLQAPVLLMLNLCKTSLRLISSPAFIALSWAGALWYSRFQWFRPNHWNLWSQAPEPQDSREFISFNGAKRFWAWYFNAPSIPKWTSFLQQDIRPTNPKPGESANSCRTSKASYAWQPAELKRLEQVSECHSWMVDPAESLHPSILVFHNLKVLWKLFKKNTLQWR